MKTGVRHVRVGPRRFPGSVQAVGCLPLGFGRLSRDLGHESQSKRDDRSLPSFFVRRSPKRRVVALNKRPTHAQRPRSMKTDQPVAIRREDYEPAPYRVTRTSLEFLLEPAATRVHATLDIEPQQDRPGALELHGEHLKLIDIKIEGRPLAKDAYSVTEERLII